MTSPPTQPNSDGWPTSQQGTTYGDHDVTYRKIITSEYGAHPDNFHVTRNNDAVNITLTYPPWTDADNTRNQVRYVEVNQESVRASDGIRLHYDYQRDGFVVEQPQVKYVPGKEPNCLDMVETWIEVGFFQSWRFDTEESRP